MKELIVKYLSGETTENEKLQLLQWLRTNNHITTFQKIKSEWESETIKNLALNNTQDSWNILQDELLKESRRELQRSKLYLKVFRYAAIFLGVFILLGYGAKVAFLDAVPKKQFTTVKAGFGQVANIILPDQTTVWLNSGSQIKYNNDFASSNRDIELVGEAYFSVTKNKKLPFIVDASNIQVKVHGTKFDMCAYPEDGNINVILEEGIVELTNEKNNSFSYFLKPGEIATFNISEKKLRIKDVKASDYTGWKNGSMIFVDTPMGDVLRKLERKFNIEFEVQNPEVYKSVFNAKFRNENLLEILDYIEYTCPISYDISKDGITRGSVIKLKSK